MKNQKKGFTLVELVIVIAVIAVLSAVLIPTFSGVINNANEAKDKANAKTMTTELMLNAVTDSLQNYTPQEVRALTMQKTSASNKMQSKGNSYWYNTQKNQVEVQNTRQMVTGAESTAGISIVYADGGSSTEKTLFSLAANGDYVYIFGDETLDYVVDILSNLTTYARLNVGTELSAMKAEMDRLYNTVYDKVKDDTQLEAIIKLFNPKNCLYFDNVAIYGTNTSANYAYENYVVVNGTTKIAGAPTGDQIAIKSTVNLVFPSGCKTSGNSFKGVTVSGNGTIDVSVPSENSATGYVIKQSVTDMLNYASSNNAATENIKNALKESYEFNTDTELNGVDFANVNSVIEKVENKVANQVSSAVLEAGFNVQMGNNNKIQYSELAFGYKYIQAELLAQNANGRDLFFRTNNTVIVEDNATSISGFESGTVTISAALNKDKNASELLSGYSATNAAKAVSEYLVATIEIQVDQIIAELNKLNYKNINTENFKLGDNDVIRFSYQNYRNYVVVSGACVFHTKDANGNESAVNYKIAPVVYLKRVSTAYVTMDVLSGLNNKTVVSVPDVASYLNGKNFIVKGVVGGVEVELSKVTVGAHAGKYYYKNNGTLSEVRVYDGETLVFRQFIA